ncbi:MAG TPA: hypothetical protein ENN69_00835 [Spirochaetia bacterium]|nr:hypothetical protein [Spirochaetia bacterium]
MKEPNIIVLVEEIAIHYNGRRKPLLRSLVISCPWCRVKKRGVGLVPVRHVHGGGVMGEPLLPFEGPRTSHCKRDPRTYTLEIPEELVDQFGTPEERSRQ